MSDGWFKHWLSPTAMVLLSFTSILSATSIRFFLSRNKSSSVKKSSIIMGLLSGRCHSKARLDGKTAVVTGCNTGLGKETVLDFVKRGCRVIMACRDLSKAKAAAEDVASRAAREQEQADPIYSLGETIIVALDLSSLASVRQCARQLLETEPAIHLLINNAGVMSCPRSQTKDGFEYQLGVNHLGHFLFTSLLLPKIRASGPARIVNVSSIAYMNGNINFDDLMCEKSYTPTQAYCNSKLANILFTKELSRRLEGTEINTYCLHPGLVATELGRHFDDSYFRGMRWLLRSLTWLICKPVELGAQTSIYCAVDEKCAHETGLYYSDCKARRLLAKGRNEQTALRLWEESSRLVGLDQWDPISAPTDQALPEWLFHATEY